MKSFFTFLALSSLAVMPLSSAYAQSQDDEIVVTGLRATAGGAQDIKHFRGGVEAGSVPSPKGMTSEGLLSEHDLYLTSQMPCAQILCLNSSAKEASIVPGSYFAGFGFDTNIGEDWSRAPLNLVAVIDRSGSMGVNLNNLRDSLFKITDNLREGDQISFVLYGSDVVTHLNPLRVTEDSKSTIREKINSIVIEGSTNMDAGLARGYDIAYNTLAAFNGATRLMIFTDERPNTGRTDAEGFMARARRASLDNIGLTTIGYGRNYGSELAAQIASVRGGNLFYVGNKNHIETLFDKEFDFMVSEVANDMTVRLTPALGLTVKDIYGVPEHMISFDQDGSVAMTIPSVFMSSSGGGLFATLQGTAKNPDASLVQARLAYNQGTQRRSQLVEARTEVQPSETLIKAEALSAQYTAMKTATEAYYKGDHELAFDIFNPFAEAFAAQKVAGLEKEYELVAKLSETLAIDAGRLDMLENPPQYARLRGVWEVTRAKNFIDVHKGDRFDFSKDYVEHYRKSEGFDVPSDTEAYDVNEKQVYLNRSDLTFKYSFTKDGKLRLRHRDGKTVIYLKLYTPDT